MFIGKFSVCSCIKIIQLALFYRLKSCYTIIEKSKHIKRKQTFWSKILTSDQMINKVGGNIQEKAALIWNVANTLVGLYKPHEYGLVILPMCIIKRFHDCLLPTHKKVLETYEKIKALEVKDGFLLKASGYQFYNTSKFTFETLVADPDNIADNFEDYINGFSDNVKDILHRMKFEDQIKTMKEGKVLYQVISDFNSAKADMNPEKISAIDMGYIFENLVQRFSESYDEETGRMAIIQNGSSLFSGDAGSGQSEIRRYLIENDWLDAIIQLPNDSFYNTGIATYIWIVTKNKDEKRLGRVQLIDASNCYESRHKNIGNKRVDLTTDCRNLILRAYDEYSDKDYEEKTENGNSIICKSKVLDSVDLGYNKITVESPLLDENGETVKDKKGKTQSDSNKRDYENVPLDEDIDKYFEREVLPYNKASWIDKSKTKVGYEIPFTRTFYVYKQLEKADEIASRIEWHEKSLMEKLRKLFEEE